MYIHHTTIKHACSTHIQGSQRKYGIHLATGLYKTIILERIMKKLLTRCTEVTHVLALSN
jgi:hypothetical protein